ncbi:hypothetical protein EVAR_46741_1 [Eumeta japonica]|uniref:Uncharacterized protein n=1 Tax=Eumeta variegata TaxID=151549 RepID=A0A4C2AB30_EUMVA|nr:hypothetical protein EVAR_46741_1 [Eumeta japonica]
MKKGNSNEKIWDRQDNKVGIDDDGRTDGRTDGRKGGVKIINLVVCGRRLHRRSRKPIIIRTLVLLRSSRRGRPQSAPATRREETSPLRAGNCRPSRDPSLSEEHGLLFVSCHFSVVREIAQDFKTDLRFRLYGPPGGPRAYLVGLEDNLCDTSRHHAEGRSSPVASGGAPALDTPGLHATRSRVVASVRARFP